MDDAARLRRREEIAAEVFHIQKDEATAPLPAFLNWMTDWVIDVEEKLSVIDTELKKSNRRQGRGS
jgi:hypothetical protein